jgi:dTDP-4-dehydrorhamnose reductase
MRLLIAGWQGQIAHALVDIAPGRRDVTAFAVGRPALDICEITSVERALGDIRPDIVINTAAYTAVDTAESEPERAFRLNRDGARLLATAAARRGVPILHISTDYVFDGSKGTPYVESDLPSPATAYGRSKLEGEAAVIAANPKHIILRTAWVHSPFGRNFVKTVLGQARETGHLRVVADQRGSPTYAPHLVQVMLDIANRATTGGTDIPWGIYHAAGSGSATWHEVAGEVLDAAKVAGVSARLEAIGAADFPTRAPRPVNAALDCTKLNETFGFALPPWQEGVRACVAQLLSSA